MKFTLTNGKSWSISLSSGKPEVDSKTSQVSPISRPEYVNKQALTLGGGIRAFLIHGGVISGDSFDISERLRYHAQQTYEKSRFAEVFYEHDSIYEKISQSAFMEFIIHVSLLIYRHVLKLSYSFSILLESGTIRVKQICNFRFLKHDIWLKENSITFFYRCRLYT